MNWFNNTIGGIRISIVKYLRNRNVIKRLACFLKNGKYRNTISFDCIYNTNSPSILGELTFTAKDSNIIKSNRIVSILNRLFFYRVHKKDTNTFNGTEVLISSSLTEYKVFDHENGKVLTIYESMEKMKKVNDNKILFKDSFNVPETIDIKPEESYIIEELVPHSPFSTEDVIVAISISICDHLYRQKERVFRDESLYRNQCAFFSSRFGNSSLLYNEFGTINSLTHGDLWSSNVIFNREKYYVTDFERVGYRFFLFDFFTFVFTEWLLNGNSLLIDKYFSGRYDDLLERMCASINLEYSAAQKEDYFLSFLVVIAYERWQHYYGVDEKINQFINIYIPTYRDNV